MGGIHVKTILFYGSFFILCLIIIYISLKIWIRPKKSENLRRSVYIILVFMIHYSTNILLLILELFFLSILAISVFKSIKNITSVISHNITLFIFFVYLCFITTCIFGNYYYVNEYIKDENLLAPLIQYSDTIFRGAIQYYVCIIKYSITFYFNFTDNTIQQLQFIIGSLLSGTIMGSIYSKIISYIRFK